MVFGLLKKYLGGNGERTEQVSEADFYCVEYSCRERKITLYGRYDLPSSNNNGLARNVKFMRDIVISILKENPDVEVDALNVTGDDTYTAAFLIELMRDSGVRNLDVKMTKTLEDRCRLSGLCDVGTRLIISHTR